MRSGVLSNIRLGKKSPVKLCTAVWRIPSLKAAVLRNNDGPCKGKPYAKAVLLVVVAEPFKNVWQHFFGKSAARVGDGYPRIERVFIRPNGYYAALGRSEERSVGKEGRSRLSPYH